MSSADIRDMLDLPSQQASPSSRQPPLKRQKTDGKKLDGIHRELHNLLGENTPAVTVIENKFKEKPNWMQKPSPWVWAKFKNQARSDGLEFSHWVRGTPTDDEYAFVKFNRPIDVPTYTDDEYNKVLADGGWTPQETKYLFDMCREYDLRWLVVQDRYEYQHEEDEPPSIRTLEDLKERYYNCCRKLMELRRESANTSWNAREQEVYNSMNFNKEKEIMRKQYLEKLLSRSPAEIAEEERLILEYRKLQESSKKLVQERKELLHLLESPQTSQSFAQFQTSQGLSQLAANILASDKNRRRKYMPEGATGAAQAGQRPGSAAPMGANGQAAVTVAAQASAHAHGHKLAAGQAARGSSVQSQTPAVSKAELIQNATAKKVARRVPPGEEPYYGVSFHDKLTPGVFLRSSKVGIMKPTVQAKISSVLSELGIATKLPMPTAKVCERYEQLQQAINVLLETKKQADKLEAEVKIEQAQKAGTSSAAI
ncbi:hypothetical protein V1512DRAFT_264282 [Lipomyces arxii]|uniref:uncharacterized protein n=1 Tax=Lipomyces arxii TaxID=56418 RepID=UPI0034CFB7C2